MAGNTERFDFDCPNCGAEISVNSGEFIDVSQDPEQKSQVISGEYFCVTCPQCGEEMLVEHPVVYIDPDKKFNVYMEPEHDEDLLDTLNSIKLPEGTYRLVSTGLELVEKIFIEDAGRDDRIIEVYKYLLAEETHEEVPDLISEDIIYTCLNGEETFVVWSSDNGDGDKLTAELNPEYYSELEKNYGHLLTLPENKYAEVNRKWLEEMLLKD